VSNGRKLPYFDSVEIDVSAYQQTLAKVSEIRDGRGEMSQDASVPTRLQSPDRVSVLGGTDTFGHSPYEGLETRPDKSLKPICPHCGSDVIRSKGDKWVCQSPEPSIVTSDKPKSWKK
jgi:hypothetical protein